MRDKLQNWNFGPTRRRGFSLVELLVVVAVIAILSMIATYSAMNSINRSKQSRAMADMKGFSTTLRAGGGAGDIHRKRDPWGNSYEFEQRGDKYTLRCLGSDGEVSEGITFDTRDQFDRDIVMIDGQFVNAPVN